MTLTLKIIGSILGLALLIFLGAGLLSSKEFMGEVSDTLVAPPQDIWPILSSPDQRKARLSLDKITGNEANSLGFQKWVEHKNGRTARYEILAYSQPFNLTLALMDSSEGLRGLWTYTLSSNDGIHTTLTIQEKSVLSDFGKRSIATLTGRNKDLRAELRSIKEALHKQALSTANTTTSDTEEAPAADVTDNIETQ